MEERININQIHCDKYDYMIAASCGLMAGLVDAFFVGAPGQSVLQGTVDKGADELVKKAAQSFYRFDKRKVGKPKKAPESLTQCISYLEQAFPVPYDARYAKDLQVGENVLDGMKPGNHHLLSLSHYPDVVGLLFSIIDQFTDTGSYIDTGKVIHVKTVKSNGSVPYLQGTNVISRLFCGFVNWIGHLLSDLVGSSSTRQPGKDGRGSGIAIPFYEVFMFCDFGNFDGNSISEIAEEAFEQGYDARFAMTMAIPVVLEDLFIRVIWALKTHFYGKRSWKECIPTNKHDDLRVMLLVGNATLCVVDGIDAFARSAGDPVAFASRLNLIAWGKLVMLAFKELVIRYNFAVDEVFIPYKMIQDEIHSYLTELEKTDIEAFIRESKAFDTFCEYMIETDSEEELNHLLKTSMTKMGFELPWEGDFDSFMGNKNNRLVFE